MRFLDEVQGESSRPRASYTPPPTNDADILKFIHKKAADQRRAKVNRMAGGRLWSTSPPFLHGGPKETTPTRQSSSAHAQEETYQTQNLHDPDGTGTGLSQHCPASVFSSQTIDLQFVGGTSPSQQTESGPVAIKGPCTLWDAPLVHHHE